MKILDQEEIKTIIKQYGGCNVLHYKISKYSDNLIGYLGEHLKLTITVEAHGIQSEYKFFMKCMPRDQWLAEFLIESNLFCKEYVMLSDLFVRFDRIAGMKWRPKSLLIKEELFVFEDVRELGYQMARQNDTFNYKEMKAVVQTLAQFHAQSFLYEENISRELQRPYRIWEDYSEYLQESKDHSWRNTGRDAVIEFLKVKSKLKLDWKKVTDLMTELFDDAVNLLKPSAKYRNTVVHRDLWSNNILLKKFSENGDKYHALIVDFQTVLYCPPTLDLSSLIYFNTTKEFRDRHMDQILDFYYGELAQAVETNTDIDFSTILSKTELIESYNESVLFGMTQAAIIVPITAMSVNKREQLFCDPGSIHRINNVTRSKEILDVANEDAAYCSRITELFEDICDKYYNLRVNNNVPLCDLHTH